MQEFFSRPVKIASFAWVPGSPLFQILNPWALFFTTNTRVANRIVNYNLLRCKLHVRIMLNGNSFYYGRACASYRPLWQDDDFGTSRSAVFNDMIQETQRPHVYLNPTESRGGDIVCPFIWPDNAMIIPAEQWKLMGELVLRSFGDLKHANGATDSVTVSVMAWAEDVHMAIPTSNQPAALSPQAGPDEYGEGIVSKTANVVSKMASSMASVPQIGKYAIATSTMSNAIGKVAGMYGYSKPENQGESNLFPKPFPESSHVEGQDVTNKLSLDPKQETSVDPVVMGLGPTDEMSILSVATRESYLTSFNWPTSAGSETKLFGISVSPVLWNTNIDPLTGLEEIHMPACCFATLPFRHWRGSMKFRFQVVCSGFHKGRIRIVYDPSSQVTSEYNVNYNYVVDISNENDFTVQVGWGSSRTLLQHGTPGADPLLFGPLHGVSPGYAHNGMLSVYVLNELTTPNSTVNNDVQVNVFVSAADDFRVFNPSVQWIDNYMYFNNSVPAPGALVAGLKERITSVPEEEILSPQSGLDHPDEHHTEDQDAPVQDMVTKMANISTSNSIDAVYQGDPILSFRQCLKRYNYHSSLPMSLANRFWQKWTMPDFPLYRGYAPGAIDQTSTGVTYNYAKNTLMNYLTPAYVCRRGSIRWRYFRERSISNTGNFAMIQRLPLSSTGFSRVLVPWLNTTASNSAKAREAVFQIPSTWAGFAVTDTLTSPVLSVDLPMFQPVRFWFARNANLTAPTNNITNNSFHQYTTQNTLSSSTASPPRVDRYVAAGDDFTLAMFLGAPRMYRLLIGEDPEAL